MPTKTRLNSIQKLLIWSAGADQEILSQESCRTERYKYESIGTTVILTAIMAFCSGGYALFTVFGSLTISISLGFIWGSIIFNLDRFFILTASQNKSSSKLQFWVGAATRLSIAILLGFIVAKPLELRLFESEINQKISQQRREREREESRKDQDTPDVKRINKINEEIDNLTREKNQASDALQKARIDAIEEIEGKGVTGKPGVGTIAKERQKNVETIEKSVTFLDSRIQDLLKEKNNLIKQKSILSVKTPQKKEWQEGSLLDRISALEALSKDDPAIAITNKLITLLLIIIEIAPVLVKILSKEGLYEKLLEKETIDRMNQENLGKMAEKELSKMKELKNFQLNIEALMIEYIRLRERNKEKIEDIQMNKAKNIYQQHDEETSNFIKLCRERVTNYEDLVD
ncbi:MULTISPECIES: DUF4407 domain-containing protein [unclassified Microcystis]|uniref:DUF4407 domain-containing protein n=1 Tax=Microcystis flos-aquae Mf_QC_C_20070823_S10D TaxID=2486236 RepID=A0A552L5A6_9CHRO|nr:MULTISPECIES: DUF4407 domain-containing protein [unclassified Microcystis]MCA2818030.1 DUF4407 domain-containing protein [Microcystis sp. M085S1]MCA2857552.1 DUF4407 domain-containing protein [Microcystis sp. M065S1]TRT74306.1 MAG: DUF4407 domain-containing protein [Microcystis flos-aquae Ma_QC_C_20070823_S18]TRU02774.1 MAG: DUF4407 domain-containing protein [Microcystis flos-aquae Ma_QC_C_20070823_S18D]TRV15398.1 MAG: DUF4407 domain-containing protein [Microcystis flos-aquae Mf_QC_C_200708